MTPRTCFLPNDLDGPGFYRCLFPMRELRAKGWDAVVPPHRNVVHKDYAVRDAEVGLIPKRSTFQQSSTIWNLEGVEADLWVVQRGHCRALTGSNKKVIAENDDNSLHLPPWHRSMQPEFRKTSLRWNQEMHEGFRNCDAMTVSTPQLAEDYADFNDNIYVLRNYLDWEMWADVEQQSETERPKIRVGWMGAYDFRVGDLDVLRGVVGPWLERRKNVEFVVAGPNAEKTHDLLGIPKDQRVTIDGVPFVSGRLPEITAVMDIGLVPLQPGWFNEGKSHLKGMEYAACGIPCVATPTESYRYWIEEGVNGFFASKPNQWRSVLETLVGDDAYRRECGRNAREKAAGATVQKHIQEWADVYLDVCNGRVEHDELQGVGAAC